MNRYRLKQLHIAQSSLKNVAGLNEISSGQLSLIGAEIRAGLRNLGAEMEKDGKWGAPGTMTPFGGRNWAAPGPSES